MVTNKYEQYDSPHQFEPLMPSEAAMAPLLERASDLSRAAARLGASTVPSSHKELRALLRNMNSYYTNKIEGQHTRPRDIGRALRQDFSRNADLARKQRIAVAHIRAEEHAEEAIDRGLDLVGDIVHQPYSVDAVKALHRLLFSELAAADLKLEDGGTMTPGEFRVGTEVSVGRHVPPASETIEAFLARWNTIYSKVRRGEASVIAAAASHHRLAWVHPFADGNGRVARLHTHLMLYRMGLTSGLWSVLRSFARSQEAYYEHLANADAGRHGDLDGRGNLSQKALVQWIAFVIDGCIDQVEFMTRMLDFEGMRDRIAASLAFEENVLKSGARQQALIPLHYLFTGAQELGRAEFKAMTGLGERVATNVLGALVKRGFLASDTPYGKVRFAIPMHALRFYFPSLWPEAEQDEALVEREQRDGAKPG